jgi:SAM-dependent methyltransferase
LSTFYSDHWKQIESDRLARYENMFQFRSDQQWLIEALNLQGAERVLDFGCGPAFLAAEIASRCDAEVIAADLNDEFLSRARLREHPPNIKFVQLVSDSLASDVGLGMDRILCKNVLEYVPDLGATLAAFSEVLNPNGEILILDSDWGFVLVEPWGKEKTDQFFVAASKAFKEPHIGRKLPGALAQAGFVDVSVSMSAAVDLKGRSVSVLHNMVSYIRQFNSMPEDELQAMMRDLEDGQASGSYMFILPQFVIKARVP